MLNQAKIAAFLVSIGLGFSCGYSPSASAETFKAVVTAKSQVQSDGKVLYIYSVKNNWVNPIVRFSVGENFSGEDYEITVFPLGWDLENGLPAGSARSYKSWSAQVVTQEDSDKFKICWEPGSDGDFIKQGELADGFGVLLAEPNSAYMSSHWTVIFDDSTTESGVLDQ